MTEVTLCPICLSPKWRDAHPIKDHSISRELFTIKRCDNCTLLVTSPRPSLVDLPKYYQSDDYISHSGKSNNILNWAYLLARRYALRKKLQLINQLQQRGTALDIGCGTGEFLSTLKKDGWLVTGVEPSATARKKAQTLTAQPIAETIDAVTGPFHVITLWHVLEHLPDLDESMKKISEKLASRGTLIIAVPNHESSDSKKYGEFWAGLDVPRHLWHFSRKTMVLLLQKYGFKLTRTVPMKLDAYYVSALSEKYKRGQTTLHGLGNAFLTAVYSNYDARNTGAYSSLIYLAER